MEDYGLTFGDDCHIGLWYLCITLAISASVKSFLGTLPKWQKGKRIVELTILCKAIRNTHSDKQWRTALHKNFRSLVSRSKYRYFPGCCMWLLAIHFRVLARPNKGDLLPPPAVCKKMACNISTKSKLYVAV